MPFLRMHGASLRMHGREQCNKLLQTTLYSHNNVRMSVDLRGMSECGLKYWGTQQVPYHDNSSAPSAPGGSSAQSMLVLELRWEAWLAWGHTIC
jgi:hypothetical protein